MTKSELTDYMTRVANLESDIVAQNGMIDAIDDKIDELENLEYKQTSDYYSYDYKKFDSSLSEEIQGSLIVFIGIFILGFIVIHILRSFIAGDAGFGILNPIINFFTIDLGRTCLYSFIISIFVSIYGLYTDISETKDMKNQIEFDNKQMEQNTRAANEQIKKENAEIVKWNENRQKNSVIQIDILNIHRKKLVSLLNQTEKTLKFYYDKDIIYPKYRGLIPVTSFCDYLKSGVCEKLEGHEGCYNKYDVEVRLDMIICQLDEVLSELEDIKENQFTLYTEMTRCNNLLSSISSDIDTLSSDMNRNYEEIKEQTVRGIRNNEQSNAMLTYYAQETSRNVEYVKWLQTADFYDMKW